MAQTPMTEGTVSNVIEFDTQDSTITALLQLIGRVRLGEVIGVTVVTTSNKGRVDMVTLSVPVQADRITRSA